METTYVNSAVCYYDLQRHWTKKVEPHLSDKELQKILVRDFNRYTSGRWCEPFLHGMVPFQFESCQWWCEHRGPQPKYWRYTKHAACHWLVNFNLRLASLVDPRPWRIITSPGHSTVWDGAETLFEFNLLAFGVPAPECFTLAYRHELPPGRYIRTHWAEHYTKETP
jgi:hypothetical protein